MYPPAAGKQFRYNVFIFNDAMAGKRIKPITLFTTQFLAFVIVVRKNKK